MQKHPHAIRFSNFSANRWSSNQKSDGNRRVIWQELWFFGKAQHHLPIHSHAFPKSRLRDDCDRAQSCLLHRAQAALSTHRHPNNPTLELPATPATPIHRRSEEHTSELQSHSFISYAVFCLKKKN